MERQLCTLKYSTSWRCANGRGVPQSDAEAVKWYRKAAEQGYMYGQYNLGGMYEAGLGVPRDDGEAVKWFRKAAEQGHADAQDYLAKRGLTWTVRTPEKEVPRTESPAPPSPPAAKRGGTVTLTLDRSVHRSGSRVGPEEHCEEYKQAMDAALVKAHLKLRVLEDAKDAYQMVQEMYLAARKAAYLSGAVDFATLSASLLGGVPGSTLGTGLIKKLLGDLGAAAVKAGTKEGMKDAAAVLAGYPDDLNLMDLATKPIVGDSKFIDAWGPKPDDPIAAIKMDGALKKWAEKQLQSELEKVFGSPSMIKDITATGTQEAVKVAGEFTAKMAGNMLSVFSLVKSQMDWSKKIDAIQNKMAGAWGRIASAELELKDLQENARSEQEIYKHCIGLWPPSAVLGGPVRPGNTGSKENPWDLSGAWTLLWNWSVTYLEFVGSVTGAGNQWSFQGTLEGGGNADWHPAKGSGTATCTLTNPSGANAHIECTVTLAQGKPWVGEADGTIQAQSYGAKRKFVFRGRGSGSVGGGPKAGIDQLNLSPKN